MEVEVSLLPVGVCGNLSSEFAANLHFQFTVFVTVIVFCYASPNGCLLMLPGLLTALE